MTKINDLVEEARALQDQAVQTLGEVPDIQTLEVLRTLAKDEVDKRAIELTLLLRKRDAKARFEVFDRWADLLEKSGIRIWLCLRRQSRPDSSSAISVVMSAPKFFGFSYSCCGSSVRHLVFIGMAKDLARWPGGSS